MEGWSLAGERETRTSCETRTSSFVVVVLVYHLTMAQRRFSGESVGDNLVEIPGIPQRRGEWYGEEEEGHGKKRRWEEEEEEREEEEREEEEREEKGRERREDETDELMTELKPSV